MIKLRRLVGASLVARIPSLNEDDFVMVKLLKVENAGIWIESQDFTERMMRQFSTSTSPTTMVLFIPFSRIEYILTSLPVMSLSETSFGLREE